MKIKLINFLVLNLNYSFKKLLIKSGYHDVKITQASGDYGIDILAKKKACFFMDFNVKDIKKNIGVSAIQQAYGGISYYH